MIFRHHSSMSKFILFFLLFLFIFCIYLKICINNFIVILLAAEECSWLIGAKRIIILFLRFDGIDIYLYFVAAWAWMLAFGNVGVSLLFLGCLVVLSLGLLLLLSL